MNDNALLMMFEEVKTSLQEIKKQIDSHQVSNGDKESSCKMSYYYSEIISNIEVIVLDAVFRIANKNEEQAKSIIRQEREKLEDFFASKSSKLKYHNRHEVIFDIKSSKVFVALVSLSASLFLAIAISTHLYIEKQGYLDNDLKYRYIKSVKGINKQQLGELENIFEYNRNDSTISKLRDHVIRYEIALDKKAKNLEKHELMD